MKAGGTEAAKAEGVKHLPRLDALQFLRYLAELRIIAYHFYKSTPWAVLDNFNAWGNSGLTFFFLLSGESAGATASAARP
jgi:peptidoglycan/LPS O-acetylase OafA/YrhL